MVSKGQKFNSYSPELKKEILNTYHNGQSSNSLALEYNLSQNTIANWVRKQKIGIDVSIDHRPISSGNKKEENINYKEKYEILKNFQAFLKAQREKK